MTLDEAIALYVDKFGGWPSHLMMGASDDYVIMSALRAVRTGEEIQPEHEDADY